MPMIDDALAMWRGPPLADFAYAEFARLAIVRLEELRLRAIEDTMDVATYAGNCAQGDVLLEAGAAGYITKGSNIDEVIAAI